MAYAKDTSVSVSKTEAEIKAVIRRYGATSFASFETTLDGLTVGEHVKPNIALAYEKQAMQPLLPAPVH